MGKLILHVIVLFAGAVLSLACVLMIFAQNLYGSVLQWAIGLLGFLIAVFCLVRIIALNREWKKSKSVNFPVVASWTIEGKEWEQYKFAYLSVSAIKKDSISYAAISAILVYPFSLIILLTTYHTTFSLVVSALVSLTMFVLVFTLVFTVNLRRKLPQWKASRATVECGTEVVLFNGQPIFFSTPQLRLVKIRTEAENDVNSLLFVLEFRMGYRTINQEHRIPVPRSNQSPALGFLEVLKKQYNLN